MTEMGQERHPPPNKLVELVLLMGNDASTAALLCALDMQVPEGKPILPVP